MINMTSSSAQLYFTTARLLTLGPNGQGLGTSFFFNFKVDEEKKVPCLITNKHVVEGADKIIFAVHEAINKPDGSVGPSPTSFTVTIENAKSVVYEHPGDVDLCAIPVAPIEQAALQLGKAVFVSSLDEDMIPNQQVLETLLGMEEVVMVGYPRGICDETNNLPVLRRGVTASHPCVNFNGKNWGAVDIGFYQGSSGSPILAWNEGAYVVGREIKFGSRGLLLGTLFGGPMYQADGTIKIGQPQGPTIPTQTSIPIHMGYYIKASELLVLKEHILKTIGVKTA